MGLARPFIARSPGAPGSRALRRRGEDGVAAPPELRCAARLRGAAARQLPRRRGRGLPASLGGGAEGVPSFPRLPETFPSPAGSRLGRGGGRQRGRRAGRAGGACQAVFPCPAVRAARCASPPRASATAREGVFSLRAASPRCPAGGGSGGLCWQAASGPSPGRAVGRAGCGGGRAEGLRGSGVSQTWLKESSISAAAPQDALGVDLVAA